MFMSSRKPAMKWSSLLNDLKEKVRRSGSSSQQPLSQSYAEAYPPLSPGRGTSSALAGVGGPDFAAQHGGYGSPAASPARGKPDLELQFKNFWEEFCSSSSEKEKEMALNMTVDIFCRLVKQQPSVAQLIPKLVETHIFSFVVGRAFVTDVEKLRIYSKGRSMNVTNIISFFSEVEDGISPGLNFLYAVEVLVAEAIDKQHLLDSGILCCLIHILNALLSSDECKQGKLFVSPEKESGQTFDCDSSQVRRLEIEESIVHIMKALASHPSAATSLIEDDSLQLLFHMVTNGSLSVFAQFRDGLIPLHMIQLHRHAMQILGLLLVNDNGGTATYIHKHHLIKILLSAVKDFNSDKGDPAYTMDIVDLLLECVELSFRPEAGAIRLREDIHNAHGYQFLVQFALTLSRLQKDQTLQPVTTHLLPDEDINKAQTFVTEIQADNLSPQLSPVLSRLLDFLVNLAQTGLPEPTGGRTSKSSQGRTSGHSRGHTSSFDKIDDESWEKGNAKIKDLEAIQMLQDIFLKADNVELQAEVLNRIFKIFSCHFENYKLCQQLRTVPLLIQNMSGFPPYLQDIILKILEYAATVVNFIPEQELLSLCCLLQQPITTNLKYTILAFFVKLLSFDQQYKKVLREVGVLEILLDDLKQHNYFLGEEQQSKIFNTSKMKFNSSSFKKHIDNKDVILSAPKLMASHSGKFLIFEKEGTITIGWDCLFSLLKEAEVNQQSFRSSNGVSTILPFLVSDNHRSGVLRILSCLIIEDSLQDHQNELGALIEILKSGMVSSFSGSQYKLHIDAKCDIFSALWRILGANSSAQKTFGELTGFSLLLTTLHSFHRREYQDGHASLLPQMKVFSFLMRAVTAGVSYNMINRLRLHTVMSSQTFYDLLCESGLLCVECEKEVIQLSLDLALETVLAPSSVLQSENSTSNTSENGSISFFSFSVGPAKLDGVRVYNPSAVSMLIHSLLHFTPKVQLDVLKFIEKLARASHFNQENLTSVGCVGLLLETISPFLEGSSPLLAHSLRIVEVLGAYRLSSSELRILVRYIFQLKKKNSGHLLVDMLAKLIQTEDIRSDEVSLAPFIEMDMSKLGHASIQVSLGERTWPPAAGYSFVCWFQYHNLKSQVREVEQVPKAGYVKRSIFSGQILRLFSVGAVNEENTLYAELCLQDNRVITLATSNICSLSFPAIDMEEGRWHHLAVVHSKPNALAGFFQASVAYLYINGKLMHTGKLGYSPSPFGKSLQVTIGTTHSHAKTSELQWRLRSCYLFEEVLTSGNICLMYILGRGYRGIFQDTDLLRFVPNQACGGGSMATLDSLENVLPSASSVQRLDASNKQGNAMSDASGIVWDLERLMTLSTQLTGKKLIFAFDGTSSEAFRASGTLSLLNLIDPVSAAASPIGGIPRYGRLSGDVYICNQSVIGDIIRTLGGMTVVLALIEIVETTDMLHMALELLACSLHQNPQNVKDMKKLRGYHLLALFLHRRMSLFDMRSLDIFFRIATCEISFSGPQRSLVSQSLSFPAGISPETSLDDISLLKSSDEISSVGSHENIDQFSVQKYSFSYLSELEKTELSEENSNCIVLSNADMVEHVLLDWTLWVTAPVSVQIALLAFLERMVSMQWYRNHNLTLLRQINFVQHLLVILQRGDVEVPVLEKLIALLGVTLEDGFVPSELELVANFVIMTFDPPEASPHIAITREMMGKHVIVRNMLLEMLIDLQVTINAEELLEQWHTIVSSKLITFFLNEAVHPTSMRWIMTLLGVCLVSPTFVLKFRATGDYQGLFHILPSFYDSPEIYYIIFCLILGKDVYPRVPEVRMLDFFALLPSDGTYGELKFVDLLEVVISMAKATFDKVSVQLMLAHQNGNISHSGGRLVADLIEENTDIAGDLQGEALIHKTYAARLMDGDAGAPNTATSILRFMVDLAKTFPPFSGLCRKTEFLESCVDLYFSCVRADCAVKMAKELTIVLPNENMSDDEKENPQNIFCSLPPGNEHSANTSTTMSSFPREQKSTTSEDLQGSQSYLDGATNLDYLKKDDTDTQKTPEGQSFIQTSVNSVALDFHNSDFNEILDPIRPTYSVSSPSIYAPYSPNMSENTNTKMTANPGTSPVLALTSLLGSTGSTSDSRTKLNAMSSMRSFSLGEFETSSDVRLNSHGSSFMNTFFPINPKLLLQIDDSGYGGGLCSAGATAVLDFIAEILADIITEQLKATQFVEHILEAVPLYADAESVLVFQGLCLNRLMNFLERRFLRDDEEDETKLDKNRWSVNLDSLCWMIVDRAYMGSFPEPVRVFRILEFLLSMLQLANKDGRIEDAAPPGKGILSMTRGSKLLESYIHAMLKNTNRIIMYCFLPLFLKSIGEDDLLTNLSFQSESGRDLFAKVIQDESAIDIGKILQLMVANKRLVLCPANVDIDLVCCLCVNMIALLNDKRPIAQSLAVDVIKYLLSHRQSAIEDLLVSKPNQGPTLDALHGGFDRLLTGNPSAFFEWLNTSEKTINKVLEHCASIMWVKYVVGSAKFPGMRIKGMEVRRKREIGRKSKEAAKLYMKNWEQINERRDALESLRDVMSAQLRAIRQDKYSWVLHAESEWQTQVQQLVHERGVFPIQHSSLEPEWKLCPIEGPYRMRKKLERCKLVIHTIQNLVTKGFELQDPKHTMETQEHGECMSDSDSGFNFLTDAAHGKLFDSGDYEELIKEDGGFRIENSESARVGWNNDQCSSVHEPSLHSAPEFGAKSSSYSLQMTKGLNARSELGSPRQSSTMKVDDMRTPGYKQEKELLDNGEYLIRPYLEPSEKIRFKYNCERVVGLDKHDGIFLIGNLCLYVIENFYIDDSGCICEKESEDDLSVIDKTLGVKRDVLGSTESDFISSPWNTTVKSFGGRAWAYNGGAWGREKLVRSVNLPHQWHMWKLDFIHELLRRDYQLRPVAIEVFSMDGCNDLLVFHKKEREEVFRNLVSMNIPRNSMLDMTISGTSKQEANDGSRLFKIMAKSFSRRWQNGEISNFQYLMHLNTLAGRGYSDLTQYPVFPWVLADYESENLDFTNPHTFRKLEKPIGCQTQEGEDEFRKRYESWDDPDVPKFHYGSHYSSAGIVLFYLIRLPPFSTENQKLQGGQFDHADRLFNSIRDTWLSAAGKSNTSDVKELIPEFFYLPEFLENRFNLDLGEKQSGQKVDDVILPPWAKGSVREFIRKHREALESDYVSENLHHWIDLIFGYKQRGKAAEEAVNVFYHCTYEGNVDIDSVSDPTMKASILAQINHFGQTPKQLFPKPHVIRQTNKKLLHPLRYCANLVTQQIRKSSSSISQIVTFNEKILIAGANSLLKPVTYSKYISWGFPDRSLRLMSYDQDKLLSTHENLHGGNQIQCAGLSHDGQFLVTGADDGVIAVWRFAKDGVRVDYQLSLERALCAHTSKITCLHVSQPYTLIVTGSEDCSVILWDLANLVFVKQLPLFPAPVSAVHVNELTGEILTAAGILLAVWSINGDCLAVVNTSQLPSDLILSVTSPTHSDWQETNWYVTGHQSGALKVWNMVHCSTDEGSAKSKTPTSGMGGFGSSGSELEYKLILRKVFKYHQHPVRALHLPSDLKQLLSGDESGSLRSWTLPESLRTS